MLDLSFMGAKHVELYDLVHILDDILDIIIVIQTHIFTYLFVQL